MAPTISHTPGWRTSEFWITLFTVIGGLSTQFAAPHTGLAVAGPIASAVAAGLYNVSRATVKSATADANASIAQAQAQQ